VPADQRYKGISGMTGRVSAFASPDGIQWRKLVPEPVVEGYDSQHMAFWDAPRGEYRAYLRHRHIALYQDRVLHTCRGGRVPGKWQTVAL
jgi:hypothetical protein